MNKNIIIKKITIDFLRDLREFSLDIAFGRVISILNIPFVDYLRRSRYFWNKVYKYIRKHYSNIVSKTISEWAECNEHCDNIIWVMWWQGEKSMPPIIEICHNQLKSINSSDNKIVLITKDNYDKYISLPNYMIRKVENGNMSITQLSDIVRCKVLRDYGGLWLDASIFASELNFDRKLDFFTLRTKGQLKNYFSEGNWGTFVMYCKNKKSLLMSIMFDVYEAYWKEHDKVIIYELPDYIIKLAYEMSPIIKKFIDGVPDSYNYRDLLGIMNDKYNQEAIESVLKICSFQKLSYKFDFNNNTVNDKKTNYLHMVETILK